MRVSHEDHSNPKDMCSLGVVDLDLSLSPDAFGLRAFDSKKPLTRTLPRSSPCELRLMLPDSKLGTDGFHDVFTTMKRRASHRPDRAFRHSVLACCPICEVKIESDLDVHMISSHLELGQLWRLPGRVVRGLEGLRP